MAKIKITQVKSVIGRPKRQKDTVVALGLRKLHKPIVHEVTPQLMGMIAKVEHLLKVEEA